MIINRILMLTLCFLTVNTSFAVDTNTCPQQALDVSGAWSDGGYSYSVDYTFGIPADNYNITQSTLRFFENGLEIGLAHSKHEDIRNIGLGRFSHWSATDGTRESIRFSTSDDTDPRTNGKSYSYCVTSTNNTQAPTVPIATTATTTTTSASSPANSCTQNALDVSGAWSDGGYSYAISKSFGIPADNANSFRQSTFRLFENGLEMGPPHSSHNEIRNVGLERFSHWSASDGTGESIRFSASNNTDPRTNGNSYSYCLTTTNGTLAPTVPIATTATTSTSTSTSTSETSPTNTCTQTTLNVNGAIHDDGYSYTVRKSFGTRADNKNFTGSTLRFFENGLEMGPPHSLHADIRNIGLGRFSHWSATDGTGESIRFSASNNTDPRTNGKSYSYCSTTIDTPNNNTQAPIVSTSPTPTATTTSSCAPAPTSSLVVNAKDTGATGNGVTNDTAAIQAAINQVGGTGGTVLIPVGTYMIDAITSLKLKSKMTLKMESGTTLKAITNNSSLQYNIIEIRNVSNVNVIGGTLQGERATHTGGGQFGHGVGIYGSSNVAVAGVTSKNNWGDGFYIGGNATNSTLCSVVADNNRRQGLSITKGTGFVVRNSIFKNTNGTQPQCGIDIEPDFGANSIDNVQIINSEVSGNASCGIVAYAVYGPVTNVTLEGNKIYDPVSFGIIIHSSNSNTIRNNTIGSKWVGIDLRGTSTANIITGNSICAPRPIDGNSGNTQSSNILNTTNCQISP